MPDFYAPYRSDPSTGGGLQTLKDMMSLRGQQLDIQAKQQGLQGQAADVQVKQQGAAQNAAAGRFFKNFDLSQHIKDDGTLDLDSAMTSPDLKATGSDAPAIIQQLVGIKNSQLAAKQALAGVNGTLRDQFRQTVGGLAADPDVASGNNQGKGKVLDAIDQFAQSGGPDAARIAGIYKPVFQNAPADRLGAVLKNSQLQAMSAGQQAEATKASAVPVQGRGGINYVNTNPNAPQPVGSRVGQPVTDQGTAPAIMSAPNGQLVRVGTGGAGLPNIGAGGSGGAGSTPAAGKIRTAQDDAPGPNSTDLQRKQYEASSTQAQKDVMDARETDKGYGNSIAIAKAIRHLAPEADTGPWREALNKILAGVGANTGANNQELGAFLDRQAATLRTQMGLPETNAGAADSKQIAGNTGYATKVIMDKNDYTQALVEGAHQYRNGLDRIEGFSGQANPKAVNAFKSAWTNNFDPNVYKLEIAKEQGKKAFDDFVNSLDPKEAASLSQKRKNLQALANGQIPQ